ncbi:type II toxin-antitoxin system VapC family toxin [Thiorhodovibrio frisius]|uniref:Ribonuclease VapC n=1 Tax=Thiorhodovibrio frisius TaxID=631362 RepID=H8Z479_9GAMM|nr:type II toxin-antitoxin system VapC family toxin [Thiorhodovibrio frisius]EIC20136.1 putative nucleic acid-binding protein [Thiorhodovibrio frisius]WPL20872.1 putative ribonuclease FitB [Thiorhodovibrio frisius]
MILLDTNVVSEPWKKQPDPRILAWLDAQVIETLYLSVVTVAELRYGIATMPEGKRRTIYRKRLEHEVLPHFTDRVLAFDVAISETYAELTARARTRGKAIGLADGYIAATAASHKMRVATRDIGPFEDGGVDVINPWRASL